MAKVLLGTSAGNGNSALQDWSGLLSLRLTVGPAAYIVLTVMVLQHPVLSNHAIALTGDVLLGLSVAGLANVLAFLGLALLYAWRRIVFHGLRYQAIVAVLLVAGIVGEFALSAAGEGVLVPMVAANVLSGVGLACLAVGQVRLFAGAPSRQAAANLFVGMFGAALVIALAAVLDSLLSLLVCLLLVGVSFAALGAESGRGAAARYGEKTPLAIPWKLVATLAVQGLSTGFVQKSGVLASQEGFFLAEGIAFALADILALVCLWRLNRDFNHLLYVIAFPLLALGHLAMVLMGETLGAVVVHEIGYRFIMFLSWMLAAWVIKHKELSANWVWPCIMCAFVGGRVAGMACGTLLGSIGGADGAAAAQMVAVFVVLFSALLLFGGAGVGDGWGMSRAATDGENAPGNASEAAVAAVAHEYGLTPRETEIVSLLARGRDQAFIAEYLHISVDTVKTHRRSIYRKLDIHSHQELLTLLEDARATLGDDASPRIADAAPTLLA